MDHLAVLRQVPHHLLAKRVEFVLRVQHQVDRERGHPDGGIIGEVAAEAIAAGKKKLGKQLAFARK